jgi:site-specific DNA-methyltransferase (adenine-specific)
MEPGSPRLIFADPPFNIGVDYGDHHNDRMKPADYLAWCRQWIPAAVRVLASDGSMWVLINDEWAADFRNLLRDAGLHLRSWVIWYERFGVNCTNKFNRTHRHLFYTVRDARRFTFHRDAVTTPSARQAVYGDKRANPEGKILDDVWIIPRVAGTHRERIKGFPTQLPEELLRRVVGCASDPGDLVIDPFSGSATTGAACLELGRRYIGIEQSKDFADRSRRRLSSVTPRLTAELPSDRADPRTAETAPPGPPQEMNAVPAASGLPPWVTPERLVEAARGDALRQAGLALPLLWLPEPPG